MRVHRALAQWLGSRRPELGLHRGLIAGQQVRQSMFYVVETIEWSAVSLWNSKNIQRNIEQISSAEKSRMHALLSFCIPQSKDTD